MISKVGPDRHTHIHMCNIHAYTCTHTQAHMPTHTQVHMHTQANTDTCACMYIRKHACRHYTGSLQPLTLLKATRMASNDLTFLKKETSTITTLLGEGVRTHQV